MKHAACRVFFLYMCCWSRPLLKPWGVLQDNLVWSTGLTMWIGHRKEIRKLTFRALAFRRSERKPLYIYYWNNNWSGMFEVYGMEVSSCHGSHYKSLLAQNWPWNNALNASSKRTLIIHWLDKNTTIITNKFTVTVTTNINKVFCTCSVAFFKADSSLGTESSNGCVSPGPGYDKNNPHLRLISLHNIIFVFEEQTKQV